MAKKASRFILIFALLWSVMVLAVDGFIARTFIRQGLSLRYEATEGRIIGSEIITHQSDRVRYGQGSAEGRLNHVEWKCGCSEGLPFVAAGCGV